MYASSAPKCVTAYSCRKSMSPPISSGSPRWIPSSSPEARRNSSRCWSSISSTPTESACVHWSAIFPPRPEERRNHSPDPAASTAPSRTSLLRLLAEEPREGPIGAVEVPAQPRLDPRRGLDRDRERRTGRLVQGAQLAVLADEASVGRP